MSRNHHADSLRRAMQSLGLSLGLCVEGGAFAGGNGAIIGHDDLVARLGAGNVPDGAGVVAGQVEGPDGNQNYAPDTTLSQFSHIMTWVLESGPSGENTHARQVGRRFYGSDLSFSTGIDAVHLWEVNDWLGAGHLRVVGGPSSVAPLATPGGVKILNHSWIGDYGSAAANNDALRRADLVADRDGVVFCVGTANAGQGSSPLLNNMFNCLVVGRMDGMHDTSDTAGTDSPGRIKPHIVAPGNLTSYTTGTVSSCMAILAETAAAFPARNANALRPETLRAAALAGASHGTTPPWTNNPQSDVNRGRTARPLDDTFGAGIINVDRSHRILTGGETNGASTAGAAPDATFNGWDLRTLANGSSSYYRFLVTALADEVVFAATWNRLTSGTHNASYVANLTLTLWRVDGKGALQTLVGDAGLPYFADGNVVSESAVDNNEYLRILDLQPGEYILQVSRSDSVSAVPNAQFAVAWKFPDDLPAPDACPEDIVPSPDGDGSVTIADIVAIVTAFGLPCADCDEDIAPQPDGDGQVTIADVTAVVTAFGPCR
jgi:hypothetical protein